MFTSLGRRGGVQQQAGARNRGERHGRQQLRIIPAAGALIGVRPAIVEDVFAVGMRLGIERYDTGDLAVRSCERKMLRRPSRAGRRRAALLHRIEKSMRNRRVHVAGTGIPGSSRYFGYRRMDPNCDSSAAVVHPLPSAWFPNSYSPILLSISGVPFRRKDFARAKICFAPPLSSPPRNRLISRLTADRRSRTEMRVLRRIVTAFPLAVLPLIAAPASAETLGDARVGFSAERVLVINGQIYVGRMWHMPGEQRHEQDLPALRPIFILRADSAIGDIILPKLHTVVEFALPKELSILGDSGLLRKPVGPETVNGIATIKYEVDEKTQKGRAVGALWLSQDGIPMKCDARVTTDKGKVSTIRWELRHVKIGAQDAALFEIPRDYAKLPPEAAAPLLGMRLARPPAR